MTNVVSLPIANWDQSCTAAEQEGALRAIESGNVLFLPQLRFSMLAGEDLLFSSRIAAKGKNVSLDPVRGTLRGMDVEEAELERLRGMMKRFADSCSDLLGNLLPSYTAGLQRARTSFRPVEIAGRSTSWRKDDTRLHVDSFPSAPTQGKRILRVFSNVNPHGQSRTWRLGESFEGVARRYLPSMAQPIWGTPELLHMLGITKSRRSHYDHFMLGLHDRMKADLAYQSEAAQSFQEFHTGSTWIVFSDQVSHAAMRGQYALEQTFHVPVECMLEPQQAPLRILERLVGHALT
jgi:3-deoxy-D-manno-oct-2-ulosonic acid (Kdo) hydroxylase